MPKQKTDTEIFVETCAGIYRAITELDQVARPHGGDDLQREAWKATGALQKTLDTAIKYWNEERELPRISLCASVGNFYLTDKCDIYAAGLATGGFCAECSRVKGRA
jgi:hypothetical protein